MAAHSNNRGGASDPIDRGAGSRAQLPSDPHPAAPPDKTGGATVKTGNRTSWPARPAFAALPGTPSPEKGPMNPPGDIPDPPRFRAKSGTVRWPGRYGAKA